jgi:hypothetical protein
LKPVDFCRDGFRSPDDLQDALKDIRNEHAADIAEIAGGLERQHRLPSTTLIYYLQYSPARGPTLSAPAGLGISRNSLWQSVWAIEKFGNSKLLK